MINRIIVGMDGSSHAKAAVEWSVQLAAATESELLIAHVLETDPARLPGGYAITSQEDLQQLRDATAEALEGEWSAAARDAGIGWRPAVLEGNPAGALIDLAARERADLIVTGRHGRGSFAELLLGSVSNQLVHHSATPVVVVPGL